MVAFFISFFLSLRTHSCCAELEVHPAASFVISTFACTYRHRFNSLRLLEEHTKLQGPRSTKMRCLVSINFFISLSYKTKPALNNEAKWSMCRPPFVICNLTGVFGGVYMHLVFFILNLVLLLHRGQISKIDNKCSFS